MKTNAISLKFFAVLIITLAMFTSASKAQSTGSFNKVNVQTGTLLLGKKEMPYTKVMLGWNLDATVAISNVEVEASFDMVNFTTVTSGVQPVAGNETTSSYVFEDMSPVLTKQPMALYRVKITDAFGRTSYTETKLVPLKS